MPGRLTVQRPSPTTVSFTVSNAPRRSNTPAKILWALQILLRAVLFCAVVFVTIARFRHTLFENDGRFTQWHDAWANPLASRICHTADTFNPLAIMVVSAVVTYGVFRREYTGRSTHRITGLWHTPDISVDRGIPPGHSWFRDPNFYLVLYLSLVGRDEVHPHNANPRHRHP